MRPHLNKHVTKKCAPWNGLMTILHCFFRPAPKDAPPRLVSLMTPKCTPWPLCDHDLCALEDQERFWICHAVCVCYMSWLRNCGKSVRFKFWISNTDTDYYARPNRKDLHFLSSTHVLTLRLRLGQCVLTCFFICENSDLRN